MVCNLTHDEETQKKVLPYRHNKRTEKLIIENKQIIYKEMSAVLHFTTEVSERYQSMDGLIFWNFNESKTEIVVFRPSGVCDSSSLGPGPLHSYVTNLAITLDCDFILDKQMNSVIKAHFYHLRLS